MQLIINDLVAHTCTDIGCIHLISGERIVCMYVHKLHMIRLASQLEKVLRQNSQLKVSGFHGVHLETLCLR